MDHINAMFVSYFNVQQMAANGRLGKIAYKILQCI